MPYYPMKIQPIDFNFIDPSPESKSDATKPVSKSRFKRLFERPFSNVLKTSAPEKSEIFHGIGNDEFEPSSMCLAKMVQNFMEGSNEKHQQQQQRCSRNRCNCFNGTCTESSDDEPDSFNSGHSHTYDVLKSLVQFTSVFERNLLADVAKIIDNNKIGSRKDEYSKQIVVHHLTTLGYAASICKSKWEISSSFPAGEYEYIAVVIQSNRLIIDIDFRSEFEIARSTKAYKHVLQALLAIFVGDANRLDKIITIVTEAGRQSLKKKGMPLPPWRKAEYVKAKWLSSSRSRTSTTNNAQGTTNNAERTTTTTTMLEIKPNPNWVHKTKIVTGLASIIATNNNNTNNNDDNDEKS